MKNLHVNSEFTNFHYLIEISVRLRAAMIESELNKGGKLAKHFVDLWAKKLDKWLIENYEDPGIDKKKERDFNRGGFDSKENEPDE